MDKSALDVPLRQLAIVWAALSTTVVGAAVVAYGLLTTGALAMEALDSSLVAMVAPLLLTMMAGGIVVGRRLESTIPRDAPNNVKVQRYQTARLVALALQEGPALAVVVLSALAGEGTWVIGGAVVGVWTLFLARPRRDELEALLRR